MTYYKKIGRKYIPISDSEATDGLHNGCWIVIVKDGVTSVRQDLVPNFPDLYAAAVECERDLVNKVMEIMSRAKPTGGRPLTAEQLELWNKLSVALEKENMTLYSASAHELIGELMKYLVSKVEAWANKKQW